VADGCCSAVGVTEVVGGGVVCGVGDGGMGRMRGGCGGGGDAGGGDAGGTVRNGGVGVTDERLSDGVRMWFGCMRFVWVVGGVMGRGQGGHGAVGGTTLSTVGWVCRLWSI